MGDKQRFDGLIADLFEARFPPAQSVWVEGFLTLLVELRRVFGNDLDKVMILSMVGQQMLRDPGMPPLSHSEAQTAPFKTWPGKSTNIDALARASGIPRESVRRKVNELIADNLVARSDQGTLVVSPGASARLAASTGISIRMLDRTVSAYLSMLVDDGTITLARNEPPSKAPG